MKINTMRRVARRLINLPQGKSMCFTSIEAACQALAQAQECLTALKYWHLIVEWIHI